MAQADDILADLLQTTTEPCYTIPSGSGSMRVCWFCGNPYFGADIPANHADDCPWARARKWGKSHRPKKRRPTREDGRAALFGDKADPSSLAPTPPVDEAPPVFAGRSTPMDTNDIASVS